MNRQQRFIILGTGGAFTFNVIKRLLEQGYKPVTYIQSGDKAAHSHSTFCKIKLEILKPQSALSKLLQLHNIPIHYQSQLKLNGFIKSLNIDFLLLACWPSLIPDSVIQSASKAALNLHPSLLPKFRGIDPITDQLKTKDQNFGISLHLITEYYDTGDIVFQQSVKYEKNTDRNHLQKVTAKKGADLFIQAINTHQNPGWKLIKQQA